MPLEILLVNDQDVELAAEFIIRQNKKDPIGDGRINCDFAKSGEDALQLAQQKQYDIIILDYNMPGINGYETAKKLRLISPNFRLLGYSSTWNKTNSKEVGLENYSDNPFKIVEYLRNSKCKLP